MASKIFDEVWLNECFVRLADSIVARRDKGTGKALIGLRTRGVIIADRLKTLAQQRHSLDLPIGSLDATLYRDDLRAGAGLKPIQPSNLAFDVTGKDIILCDDVISTGRSIRAAMGMIFDYGRPASIVLCAMIDRGGRELPIHPDYLGVKIEVSKGGFVRLKLSEIDPQGDAVYVVGPGEPEP